MSGTASGKPPSTTSSSRNRHEPDTIHLKTHLDSRCKLSVYFQRAYGELFDLEADPMEVDNLWAQPSAQELKARLIRDRLFAERARSRSRCR